MLLVVLFHLWPEQITGGYVGVDVFFAISGYLITGHLLREVARDGSVNLAGFWARRIRRLLPAAALVLAVSLVATVLFLPSRVWQETAFQIGASAIGLQNWALASQAVDYFGVNALPSVVQHYWSLSLEEQFYVFWPLFLVAVLLLSKALSVPARRRVLGGAMGLVFAASLTWSIIATDASQSAAYFSTLTHAWEFALGGLLALTHQRLMTSWWGAHERVRALASWVGIAAIVFSALVFTGKSPFPGWIALVPILGTVLVIAAGITGSRIQKPLLLGSRPVQFVGDGSYSTYLWHWPPIVVLPAILGHELGFATKVAILVLSVAAGYLTKRFIEDPARTSAALNHRKWITYSLAAVTAGILVVSSVTVFQVGAAKAEAAQAAAQAAIDAALDGGNPCFGAAAMDDPAACPDSHRVDDRFGPDFAADDWGSIAGVTKDGTLPDKSACVDFSGDGRAFWDCSLGTATGDTTMAIVGDSHGLALTEPLVQIAQAQGWAVRVILLNSCTPSLPMPYDSPDTKVDCQDWRAAIADRIAADPSIDLVVTTGFTRGEPETVFTGSRDDLVAGYAGLWKQWSDAGKSVYVIEDVPLSQGTSVPECVAAHLSDADPCAVVRSDALVWDPVVDAVAASGGAAQLIDLTEAFCDEDFCHAVVGGLIVYRDPHHLSATFALTLVPRLTAAIVG